MLLSPERDEREQAEQGGCGAGNSLIGPLALGLDAEMAADLGEGDLDAPATNEPAQDVARIGREIGAQEGLRAELILAVAYQHVADGTWWPGCDQMVVPLTDLPSGQWTPGYSVFRSACSGVM